MSVPKKLLSDQASGVSIQQANKLLRRFEKLRSDPKYAKVVALPSFRPAYEVLKQVLRSKRPSPAATLPSDP